MMKLTTVAVGTILAFSAYSGMASANTGTADFSAAITTKTPMVCSLEVTPPTSTLTSARYVLGEEGKMGKLTIDSIIQGDLVIAATGNKSCILGKFTLDVKSEKHTLNGQEVFGAVTKSGKGIYPYAITLGHARAYKPDGSRGHAYDKEYAGYNSADDTDSLWDGHYLQKSGTSFGEEYMQRKHGFYPYVAAGDVSLDDSGLAAFATKDRTWDEWTAENAQQVNFGVSVAYAAHPYNLETQKPDETVVEPGERLDSPATITITQS